MDRPKLDIINRIVEILFATTDGVVYGSTARYFATENAGDLPEDVDILLPDSEYGRFLEALQVRGKMFVRAKHETRDDGGPYNFLRLEGMRHRKIETLSLCDEGSIIVQIDIFTSLIYHPNILDTIPVYSPIDAFQLTASRVSVRASASVFFPDSPIAPSFLFKNTMDLVTRKLAPVSAAIISAGGIKQVPKSRFLKLVEKGFALQPCLTYLKRIETPERCIICHYEPGDAEESAADDRGADEVEHTIAEWYERRHRADESTTRLRRNHAMVAFSTCSCGSHMCIDCLLEFMYPQIRDREAYYYTDARVQLKCPVRCRTDCPPWQEVFYEAMLIKLAVKVGEEA